MDPTVIFNELLKLSPFLALMAVIIWYQNKRNESLEAARELSYQNIVKENERLQLENRQLEKDKFELLKTNYETLIVSSRHIETSNEFQKSLPDIMARLFSEVQNKIIAEIKGN